MAAYAAELQQLHSVFSHVDSGLIFSGGAEAEAVLRNAENLVDDLRENTQVLAGDEGKTVDSAIDPIRNKPSALTLYSFITSTIKNKHPCMYPDLAI